MNPNKALWEKGDFTRIAKTMRESGAALVSGLGISPGLKVLDLGCGRWHHAPSICLERAAFFVVPLLS